MSKRVRNRSTPPPATASVRVRDFDRVFWIALAFAAATLLAYQPAWHGGFLWDDDGHVTKAVLRPLGGLWRIWFVPGATQQFYPVVHSTFWVQFHLWGLNPTGYHIVSILLHATSAALLVAILRRLQVPGAVLAGAIFALHPVQVESVAWITELKNTLSGVFYFGAALVYLRFDTDRRPVAYWGAIGLFVLAIFSKSVTATLPLGLLIVFWWRRGRIEWTRDVRPLMPWLTIGIAVGVMTVWMERTFIGAEGAAFDFTLIERGLIAGRAVVFYLTTLVWPANLAFSYPRWMVSQGVWWQYLFPVAVVLLTAVLWRLRGWSRAPLAAVLFFGVTLGPALGFVNVYPFKYSFVADHFQYLACAGLIALAAAAIASGAARFTASLPSASMLALIVVGAPLALITWRDSRAYASKDALYRTTIVRNPEAWLAHNNLAALLLERDKPDAVDAVAHAREAARLAPAEASTHFNLGLALEASGDAAGAADAYRASIAQATPAQLESPRIALVHERLAQVQLSAGVALLQAGHPDQAVVPLTLAVAQAPGDAEAHFALGLTWEQLKQPDRAIEQFRAATNASSSHVRAWQHLGGVLHSSGRRDEAVAAYLTALAIDAGSADTHNDVGVALAELRRFREAEPHFAEALRLNPADAQARDNLARTRQILQRGGRGGGLDK